MLCTILKLTVLECHYGLNGISYCFQLFLWEYKWIREENFLLHYSRIIDSFQGSIHTSDSRFAALLFLGRSGRCAKSLLIIAFLVNRLLEICKLLIFPIIMEQSSMSTIRTTVILTHGRVLIHLCGSRYNVLGLSTTLGDSFFRCLDISSVTLALMENIQSMEFRHIRQLIHSVLIPLVKFCPTDLWEEWLEKLLHSLFIHSQQALSCSWSCLLREGRARVPDVHAILAGSDLKVEVMEEKLLRDLTREIGALLSVLASPGLNAGLPSLEQSGHVSRGDMSSLKDLDAFASTSMVGYV